MGISSNGVTLVQPKDKSVMYDYSYNDIESVFVDPSDDFITINLVKTLPDSHRCFMLETEKKQDIGDLIASYCPMLGSMLYDNDVPVRKVRYTITHRSLLTYFGWFSS